MITIVYLIIPIYMVLLIFLSMDEKVPEDIREKGIQEPFQKVASYIYRKFIVNSPLCKRSFKRKRVGDDLRAMDFEKDLKDLVKGYYIQKISIVLLLVTVGSLLCMTSSYASMDENLTGEKNIVFRKEYGQGEKKERLTAFNNEGKIVGDFDLVVSEKIYTKKQSEELFSEMTKELPEIIKKENENLENVVSDLDLPSKVDGYPFSLAWKSENFDLIHSGGKVSSENLIKDNEVVMLTCTATYQDMKWEHVIYANVCRPKLSPLEELQKNISEALIKREEGSRNKESFSLPEKIGNKTISWQRKKDDNSLILLLLVLMAAAAVFVAKDKELSKKAQDRKNSLLLEYPLFISRLVLYMGAGMSVRGVLLKFSDEYKKEKQKGMHPSFLYEEICKVCNELESGVSELSAYERFGLRCAVPQYTRLVTLLSQNLKKGNSELLTLLKEESDKATKERMAYARKMGEEAGTKLLLPMMMMLVIVMIVIMIPAYLSF